MVESDAVDAVYLQQVCFGSVVGTVLIGRRGVVKTSVIDKEGLCAMW